MTHEEFVGQVQARARLGTRGAAEAAVRATLETLAERLEAGISEKLSAQLPQELARHMKGDHATTFERMSLDDFFRRIQGREGHGLDFPQAVYHVRAVLEVLQEAVTPAVMEKVRASLPAEFRPIFDAGTQGQMNAGPPSSGKHA